MSITEDAPDPPWLRLGGRALAVAIVAGAAYSVYRVNVDAFDYPRTDDAVVRANVIGIAPEVGGRVLALHVQDNQEVAAGALLFEIDPAPYEAERAVAAAELDAARATAGAADDPAGAARVRAAEARLRRAELNLGYTQVRAPLHARVANMNIAAGAFAREGQPLFSLIDLDRWWVVANFQESYIDRIKPGDAAAVRLVAYPDAVFAGRVQDIGWGIAVEDGAPGAPPKVAPITNWVRIANRLPVRIALPPPAPGQPYRMGLTATVTVNRAN